MRYRVSLVYFFRCISHAIKYNNIYFCKDRDCREQILVIYTECMYRLIRLIRNQRSRERMRMPTAITCTFTTQSNLVHRLCAVGRSIIIREHRTV